MVKICSVNLVGVVLVLTVAGQASAYTWPEFGGHKYALTESYGTWQECENEAVNVGGHLVTINLSDENNWLFSTLHDPSQDFLWIGLNQIPGSPEPWEGWQWSSGELLETFINWEAPSQPDNSYPEEDYGVIVMKGDGQWNDWDHRRYDFHPIQGIIEVVPEPSSLVLLGLGALMLAAIRIPRKKR